ncbi:MAG: serine O-acetyltransferase, partial [Eubacterium sp.]|nr:serine O-acetyltransferase [Eubacterium sp.]
MGLIKFIKEEIQVVQERDPAIKSPIEVILYPTFRVMLSYRRAHRLYQKGHFFRARYISQ